MLDHPIHARDAAAVAAPRGLPGELPADELLLWQGAPDWWVLARRALHVRQLAVYFGVLLCWSVGVAVFGHQKFAEASLAIAASAGLAVCALGVLVAYAWAAARTTRYSITNRRVVMQFGVALPMSVNIPFGKIVKAAMTCDGDGAGDVALALSASGKVGYAVMWPHVRAWHLKAPQPALRGLRDVADVAGVLAAALAASLAPLPTLAAVPAVGQMSDVVVDGIAVSAAA